MGQTNNGLQQELFHNFLVRLSVHSKAAGVGAVWLSHTFSLLL